MTGRAHSPLRLLQVISADGLGGAEYSYLNIAGGLDRSVVKPMAALCGERHVDWFLRQLDERRVLTGRFREGQWRRRDPRPYVDSIMSLARVIRRSEADVVHVNHHLFHLDVSFWAARLCRVPMVGHIRMMAMDGEDDVWFREHYGRFLRRADMLVHVSQASKWSWEERGIANRNSVVVYEGVDPRQFTPGRRAGLLRTRIGVGPTSPLVGYVGRVVEDKGLVELVRSMESVRSSVPGAHLVIIGDIAAPELAEFAGRLSRTARELGLTEHITFAGFATDVSYWMADLDVLALPSWHEGFGMALVEAMASGVPPVATAVGGIPEVIRGGIDGVLVRPQDAAQLAEAIIGLLDDPGKRQRMATQGRQRACEEFSVEKQCRATEDVYLAVRSRAAGRGAISRRGGRA